VRYRSRASWFTPENYRLINFPMFRKALQRRYNCTIISLSIRFLILRLLAPAVSLLHLKSNKMDLDFHSDWNQQRNRPDGHNIVGRCGVVGSTYTRFRIHRSWVRIWAPLIFTSWCISLQQAEITGEVLPGRFSSSTAVVHSASYPPGRANRVAAYQW